MNKVILLNNQNLLDIAIQEYGTVAAVFDLALSNSLSITDATEVGKQISLINTTKDVEIFNFYKKNQIKPATDNSQISELSENVGIGYMIIGTNFRIG